MRTKKEIVYPPHFDEMDELGQAFFLMLQTVLKGRGIIARLQLVAKRCHAGGFLFSFWGTIDGRHVNNGNDRDWFARVHNGKLYKAGLRDIRDHEKSTIIEGPELIKMIYAVLLNEDRPVMIETLDDGDYKTWSYTCDEWGDFDYTEFTEKQEDQHHEKWLKNLVKHRELLPQWMLEYFEQHNI